LQQVVPVGKELAVAEDRLKALKLEFDALKQGMDDLEKRRGERQVRAPGLQYDVTLTDISGAGSGSATEDC
jgi:hypothetical protein